MTRENSTLHDRVKRFEDQLDKSHEELMDAKKNAQNYLEKLLNLKDDHREEVHERHYKEIDALREKQEKDIEMAKQSLTDLYERKIEYLSDSKEESDSRLMRAERLLKDKGKDYDEILIEYRKIEKLSD